MQLFDLDVDEKVCLASRRYLLTLAGHIFLAFFLIVMPFFLMFPLFSWGRGGIIFFIFAIVVGLLTFFKTLVMWRFNILVITTKRVIKIKQNGFFDRTVSEMLLSRINDVSHRVRGFWSTLFHYGTLHIVAGNGETVLDFEYMQNPGRALKILNGLLQKLPDDADAGGAELQNL